ncbi:hypothetical protein pb186bvf_007891 [Paramecium bursaria]
MKNYNELKSVSVSEIDIMYKNMIQIKKKKFSSASSSENKIIRKISKINFYSLIFLSQNKETQLIYFLKIQSFPILYQN